MNYNVELVTDKRGYKYIKNSTNINISILSSTLLNKNIFTIFFFDGNICYFKLFNFFDYKKYHSF